MSLGTREEIINFISNSGATLYDIAANYGTTPEDVAKNLGDMGIQLPSMSFEGPFDFIKGLQKGISSGCSAQQLIKDPFGGIQHLPRGKNGEFIPNRVLVYKAVHGDKIIDAYTGKEVPESDITTVDGNKDNYLVTNVEAVSQDTHRDRFSHPIGVISETFKFTTRYFEIEIEINKKYDQLVGGTYNPEYVHQLFCTWVGYPLNLYLKRNVEDTAMFEHKKSTAIAWWVWSQLSNYALLKGIKAITVTSLDVRSMDQYVSPKVSPSRCLAPVTMRHAATVRDVDVLNALQNLVVASQAAFIQTLPAPSVSLP